MRRFAVRTIRRGAVLIGGRRFHVDEQYLRYDGRLDGQRFAFGLYGGTHSNIVSLWGTEAQFRFAGDLEFDDALDRYEALPKPHQVDGAVPWDWWRALPEVAPS